MAGTGTRRILVELLGDETSLQRAFDKGGRSAERFGVTLKGVTRSTGGFSRGFLSGAGALSSFGGALALTSGSFFAGAGLVAGLKASVGAAADFQQTMNVLKQVTGGTTSQLTAASLEARRLGADITLPATSATDAAQAMLQLAKGGLTLKEAMAATRGTLQLAAAAQTDVATASNETARALTTFKLSGADAGKIADLLANGAQSATGDINDFALALSQSGTSAHQFGLTAQDTVAAITELAQAGILGSDAGTSLRVMLTRLLPTSKAAQREIKNLGISVHDANGNFRPFRDIIANYSEALRKLSPAERQHALQVIFGTDAQRAANIVLGDGVKNFDKLSAAVGKQGGAARAAAAQQQGFKGVLDGFNSALQTTEVTIGTALLPVLTNYLRSLSKWLSDSRNQTKIQKETTAAVHDLEKGLSAVGTVLGELTNIFKTFGDAVGGARNEVGLFVGAFVAFKSRGILSNLGLFGGAFKNIGNEAKAATGQVNSLKKAEIALNKVPPPGSGGIGNANGPNPFIFGQAGNPFGPTNKIPNQDLRANQSFFDRIFGGVLGAKTFANQGKLGGGGLILPGISPDQHPGIELKPGMVIDQNGKKFIVIKINGGIAIIPLQDFKNLPVINARLGEGDRLNPRINVPGSGGFGGLPTTLDTTGGGGGGNIGKPLTATQLNTFFDNAVARILLRGGLGSIAQQSAALQRAAALLTARIAATKDVTRKLNLEDQLLQIGAQQKALHQQAADEFMAGLELNLKKAEATSSFKDDLAALQAINDQIRAQIRETGTTVALQSQLFDNQQQIAQKRQDQRDAASFFALGLSPSGGDRTQLTGTLRKRDTSLTKAIEGTAEDTAKNRAFLKASEKILSATIPPDEKVRSAIQHMFDTIRDAINKDNGVPNIKFRGIDALSATAGLGLTPAQRRALEERLAIIGPKGTVPNQSAAFGKAGADTVVHTTVELDGTVIASNTTKHQRKTSQNRVTNRRGSYAGRH